MTDIAMEDFEAEVTSFLDAHAEPKAVASPEAFTWGQGEDDVSMFEEVDRDQELVDVERSKQWLATRAEADLHWIAGPTELGGRGLSRAHAQRYQVLEGRYQVPNQSFFGIGFGMVAPTILAHGTDATRPYVNRMYAGDLVACQLFSEPGAGSDLAGLQTRAERDGDEWIVSGQKVWTSGAQYSDIGEIICRTDPDLPKHQGLTGYVVDMKAPGVEVRPLRQMTGGSSFNEVFFNEVRVPDDHRLGDVNQGWAVALTTLMNERASIGGGGMTGGSGMANGVRFMEMLRVFGKDDDPVLRDELARLYTGYQVAKFTTQRAMANLKAGGTPGPEMSIAKLALTRNMYDTGEFVAKVLGPALQADTGRWGTYSWSKWVCGVPGMRIAGGSDEPLRNIIGERVLGLPKEPGIDTTSPFRELRQN